MVGNTDAIQPTPAQPSRSIQSSRGLRVPKLTTKGLTVLVTGAFLTVCVLKADSKDIPKIVETIFGSDTFSIVGWALAGAFLLCGAVMVKLMHSFYGAEITRIANERDKLQNLLIERGGK